MANVDAAFGLRPVRHLNGNPWNGMTRMYYVPSTDNSVIYLGDPVIHGGTAGAAGTRVNGIDVEGMPTADVGAAASAKFLGVMVGRLPKQSDLSVLYREASVDTIILVCDDPSVVFEVQEDGAIAATDVGLNGDLTSFGGSTVTGRSTVELDSSTVTTTATLSVRVLGLAKKEGNAIGANAVWEVAFNEHEYNFGVLGVGT